MTQRKMLDLPGRNMSAKDLVFLDILSHWIIMICCKAGMTHGILKEEQWLTLSGASMDEDKKRTNSSYYVRSFPNKITFRKNH